MSILETEGLKTYYFTSRGVVKAVDGVSFRLNVREILGIAGESGCGKSTIALSLMRLVPLPGQIVGGKILLHRENLLDKNEAELQKIRWSKISIVFQGSMSAFNPVLKIGDQISEAILAHTSLKKSDALKRVEELLALVGIDSSRAANYPHEFSGGMKQRSMIAMALALNPSVVIADEPTTGLDVIVQAQILKLLKNLQETLGLSMIVISHDLSLISEICDRCAVMYAGKIVEYADTMSIFKRPHHPYVQGLIKAFPSVRSSTDLISIPGSPPNLINPPIGCRFHTRCPFAGKICQEVEPTLTETEKEHYVACHLR